MIRTCACILAVVFIIGGLVGPTAARAQTKEDAYGWWKEGDKLLWEARSADDLKKAEEKFIAALKVYERLGDRECIAHTHLSLGLLYKDRNEDDKAVQHYEKALAFFRDLKHRGGEADILGNLGVVYWARGQHDKAAEYFEKDLAIKRALKDRKGEAYPLNNLGMVFADWGQYDKAAESYEKSLAIKREFADRRGEANSLSNLGLVYYAWGQHDKAAEYFEKALTISRLLQHRERESRHLINLGSVFSDRGWYDKAVECYEKGLAIKTALNERQGEALALMGLGNIFGDWGRYDEAAVCYEKGLGIARDLKDRSTEGKILHNQGVLFSNWGQYDKAGEYWESSLTAYRQLNDLHSEALVLTHLGRAQQHRGNTREALDHFRRSLALYDDMKVPTRLPTVLIARVYMDEGDLAAAEPLLKEAGYDVDWGRFHLLKSDFPAARDYYGKSLESAEENRNVAGLFTALTGLGLSCEGVGDDEAAAEYFQRAVKLVETLRGSLSADQREPFFDVRINGFYRTTPYEGLARVLLRLNRQSEAWNASEYTKARLFAEGLAQRSGLKVLDVPTDILKQDTDLANQLAAVTSALQKAYEKKNRLQIEALDPQVKELEQKLVAHKKMLRQNYPLFAATRYPEPMDLTATAVRDDERVLSYDVTDSGLLIYLTNGKQIVKALFKPIPRKEIDELVRKFRDPLEAKTDEPVSKLLLRFDFEAGKRLADILLSDVLSDIPKDVPVIIIPDDSLGIVAFEMLVLNDGGRVVKGKDLPYVTGAEFFGDRNPISYYQSITALTLARTFGKQKGSGEKAFVMDDPVFHADDERLVQGSAEVKLSSLPEPLTTLLSSMKTELGLTFPRLPLTGELGQTLRMLDPDRTEEFSGVEATKAVLFEKPMDHYRSITFATHGYFGKELPGIMEPVLVLTLVNQPDAQFGFLRLSEVMGLKLNADVVALTACQTGLGRHISGEGTMGMGRAFQYAGAKSCLMSLWSVAETSSVKLVESFFRYLKEGKSKLEALRMARQEIRKEGYDHPFFWAPFILVGEVQ